LAYVIQLEKVERQADAMLIVTGVARALGAEVELLDLAQIRADFDSALAAEPVAVDSDRAALLEGLGLRVRG
jgi:hypothetical protein